MRKPLTIAKAQQQNRRPQQLRAGHSLAQNNDRGEKADGRHQQHEGCGLVHAAAAEQREPGDIGEVKTDEADKGQGCPFD